MRGIAARKLQFYPLINVNALHINIIKMTLKPVYSSSMMYTHICINLKILYLVDEYISNENYFFTLIFTSYKLKISVIIIQMRSFLNIELCYRKFKKNGT